MHLKFTGVQLGLISEGGGGGAQIFQFHTINISPPLAPNCAPYKQKLLGSEESAHMVEKLQQQQ